MILWPPLGHNSGLQRTGSQSAPSRTILMAAVFGRPINGHLEGLRTRHFGHPAHRSCVAVAAIPDALTEAEATPREWRRSSTFSDRPVARIQRQAP